MRIIAGQFGGRHLTPPPDLKIRPTTDRVKQMIFDAIGFPFPYSRVLDLFAGSGNLGLEALSRGAESVVFVDKAQQAIKTIAANCQLLSLSHSAKIMRVDVFKALSMFSTKSETFDLIFADPPYQKMFIHQLLSFIDGSHILADNGLLVLEYASRDVPKTELARLQLIKQKQTGETAFSLYSIR